MENEKDAVQMKLRFCRTLYINKSILISMVTIKYITLFYDKEKFLR